MKKVMILFIAIFALGVVSAEPCTPDISLLNQDPYPAVPGEYVKLVFQISDLGSTDCGKISFELEEKYPLIFNPGESGERNFDQVDYIKDFKSTLQIPYEVRIDADALDGANSIKVSLINNNDATITENFDVEVDDPKVDFEVYVKEYNYETDTLTIEVLNIGESDVEALTAEVPKQGAIIIKGPNRIVAGDLDSNEYTTVEFEARPKDGDITLNLIYSDPINKRRVIEKTITFDSYYFTDRVADRNGGSTSTYIIGILVVFLVFYFRWKRKKNKNKGHSHTHRK